MTVLAHELSHALHGHKEDVDTNISRPRFLEELEADRRAGEGSVCLLVDLDLQNYITGWTGLKSQEDFMEAAMIGHSLLAWWLPEGEPCDYAKPAMRSFAFFDGFSSAMIKNRLADSDLIERVRERADRTVKKVAGDIERGDELINIRDAHHDSKTLFERELRSDLSLRGKETLAASPFWKAAVRRRASQNVEDEQIGISIGEPTKEGPMIAGIKIKKGAYLRETLVSLFRRVASIRII